MNSCDVHLYLDFKVDGQVHTAALVLDTEDTDLPPSSQPGPTQTVDDDSQDTTGDEANEDEHDEGGGHDHDQ